MRIMIALQNDIYAEYLSKYLESLSFNVWVNSDGKQILNELLSTNYDIVIIGIVLKYYNGLEIISRFKKINKNKDNTRFFVLTSLQNNKSIKAAKDLGVSEYFIIPICTQSLIQKIKDYDKKEFPI